MKNIFEDFPFLEEGSAEHFILKTISEICTKYEDRGNCAGCPFRVPNSKADIRVIDSLYDIQCGIVAHKFLPRAWDLNNKE